jgi:hypothetical protein
VTGRRHFTALLVLALGADACRSKQGQTEPQGSSDVLVPPPGSARVAGDGASPDAGKDCAARKEIIKNRSLSPLHPAPGKIVPGDGIEGHCLGDPVPPEYITAANGCEPREERRLCRGVEAGLDLFYDKNWRLDAIRVNNWTRWSNQSYDKTLRTHDGIGPGMSPDNIGWYWGLPLRTEHVKYPDFGVVEVRYYQGIALEIERHPRRAPVVGGVYVFAMGRFPRLGPLAPGPKEPAKKSRQ